MTDTYNLPMHGLKRAAVVTRQLGRDRAEYIQISYDRQTGDVLTNYHYCIGQNSWTRYHSPAVVTICNASKPMTMQQIAAAIADKMEYLSTIAAV